MSTGKISPISLLSALALVLTSTQAFAGASNKSGNPFGNGTFFGNDGTFSAVLRGKNMTGVTQFSTYSSGKITTGFNSITNAATADTAANIPGSVSVYLNGVSYVGIASGVQDPSAGTITAVFSSFSVRSATNFAVNQSLTNNTLTNISTNDGLVSTSNNSFSNNNITIQTNLSTTNLNTSPFSATLTNIVSTNRGTNSLVSTNITTTNNINSLVISTNGASVSYTAGFSQSILGGAFTANFQNKYPNQTFYGDGSVTTPQAVVNGTNTSIVADTVTFNVNGVRVSSSSSTYY